MDKYTYWVTWSEEDGQYVGLCAEFPSLSWLADTPEAALAGIRDTVKQVIDDMKSEGEPIPEPLATRNYSGKFTTCFDLQAPAPSSYVRWVASYPI